MKQVQIVIISISLISFFLTSCGDDDGVVGADAGNGKVTATVDGQSWESKDEVSGAVYAESQGTHTIQAYHENDSYLALTFFGNISSGTTIAIDNSGLFQAQYKPVFSGSELYTALGMLGSGSITFSTFNENKVKGTFEFTSVRFDQAGMEIPVIVTNGNFDINL